MTNEQIFKQAVDISIRLAKAKWGSKAVCSVCGKRNEKDCNCKEWQGDGLCESWFFHLQRMVTHEEQLQNLNEDL